MPALIQVLLLFLFLGIAFLGWGDLTARTLRVLPPIGGRLMPRIWLGIAATGLVLQVVHFFLPLDAAVSLAIFAIGALLCLLAIYRAVHDTPSPMRPLRAVFLSTAIVLPLASWIALRGVGLPPDNYDSGLYHFNAIRWIYTYPIVPGLGNLHGRLAFNSSLFPFAAALDLHPIFDHGYSVVNGFLLLVAMLTMIEILAPVLSVPRLFARSHPFRYGVASFALPPLAYVALSRYLSSPTPDLASTIFQVVILSFLCQGIADWREGHHAQDFRAMLVLVLAVTAVTLKLSNLAFSLATACFVMGYLLRTAGPRRLRELRVLLPTAAVVLVWSLRGYILSGTPLYPSTIGYIPLAWAVPKEAIVEYARLVFGWARQPGTHWSTVLASWDWLPPWFARMSKDFTEFAYPLRASLFLAASAGLIALLRRPWLHLALEWSAISLPAVSLVYWFLIAPDIRFANAAFFLLSLCSSLLLLTAIQQRGTSRVYLACFFVVFVLGNYNLLRFAVENKWAFKPCATQGTWTECVLTARWKQIHQAPLTTRTTSSGLQVLTPTDGDQCWDSPLPCTPNFNILLSLRKPGDLSSGFEVSPP